MNADELIDNIKFIADKQYESEPAQNRLAYHVGLLESHLRGYIQTAEIAQEYIKELETKLIAKESE
jgi:G:T/U-mismatch repair DNA glycosylase